MVRNERLKRIRHLRWEVDEAIPEQIAKNYGQTEVQFLIGYDKLLEDYMSDIGLDITMVFVRRLYVVLTL